MERINPISKSTPAAWDLIHGQVGPTDPRVPYESLLSSSNSIANVGCGMDCIAKVFRNKVHCIDFSKTALNYQGQFTENIIETNASKIPMRDAAVETVWCADTLSYSNDPNQIISECVRIAKSRVYLLVDIKNKYALTPVSIWSLTETEIISSALVFTKKASLLHNTPENSLFLCLENFR